MIKLVFAWVLVNGLLMGPAWVAAAVTDASRPAWISVEAALIVGGMALLPRRRWSRVLAWVLAAAVVLSTAVLMADLVFRVSLGRPLNLSLDLYLLDAVYQLAVGNSGPGRTLLGIGAATVLGGGALYAIARMLTPSSQDEDPLLLHLVPMAGTRVILGAVAIAVLGLGGSMPLASFLRDQVVAFRSTRLERVAFAEDLERQPRAFADQPGLLSGLEGHNVVLVYLESYGMAALEDPDFAAIVRPRLEVAAARIEGAGMQLVTGRLASPTLGGQSWYAHGTMLSGLWLENQLRYELLLGSERQTLVDDFRSAGYRTATVMPAITRAWPEAVRIGYDDVYTAQNIPYGGPPFYWVTMPDQFTWSFLAGVVRDTQGPLFAEVGMLSSHAPWTPVLPIVDWDDIGDGATFEAYRLEGYPPEETWWDVDALRDAYARSLAYSLGAMTGFVERFLDETTLLVVLGDHQAAPWVTGASGPDVPVHVMAKDSALLEPFLEWGFQRGPFPAAAGESPRMDEFRGWFVRAYTN